MTRANALASLGAAGCEDPEKTLADMVRVADLMAQAEDSGNPRVEGEFDPEADTAGEYQRKFPDAWDWAIAGHHGGGSGGDQAGNIAEDEDRFRADGSPRFADHIGEGGDHVTDDPDDGPDEEQACPRLARLLTAAKGARDQSAHRRPLTNEQHRDLAAAIDQAEKDGGSIGPDLLRQLLECPIAPRAGGAVAILVDATLLADIRGAVNPGRIP